MEDLLVFMLLELNGLLSDLYHLWIAVQVDLLILRELGLEVLEPSVIKN